MVDIKNKAGRVIGKLPPYTAAEQRELERIASGAPVAFTSHRNPPDRTAPQLPGARKAVPPRA